MNDLIEGLVTKGFIFKSINPRKRIYEEEKSLKKCLTQSGFLSFYNVGIRYCFLLLLKKGYDIKGNKVHAVLKDFLKHFLKTEERLLLNIIRTRHSLKYDSIQPELSIIREMNNIICELKFLLDDKKPNNLNGKSID